MTSPGKDKIHIITASDGNLKDIFRIWKCFVNKQGYDFTVYDLGGLGEGTPFDQHENDFTNRSGFVPCYFKPKIIQHALKKHDFVVYLDVDTTLNENIDEILEHEYDIGATKRRPAEVTKYQNNDKVGRYNTGVLFFRNTQNTHVSQSRSRGVSQSRSMRRL